MNSKKMLKTKLFTRIMFNLYATLKSKKKSLMIKILTYRTKVSLDSFPFINLYSRCNSKKRRYMAEASKSEGRIRSA